LLDSRECAVIAWLLIENVFLSSFLLTVYVDNLCHLFCFWHMLHVPLKKSVLFLWMLTLHVNYSRLGDQFLWIVQSEMAPPFPAKGNQMEVRLRMFRTKIMVRKFQWPMSINRILLVKEKKEIKRKLTWEEKELVQCPRPGLQLLTGLVLALMLMAEPKGTMVMRYCTIYIWLRSH